MEGEGKSMLAAAASAAIVASAVTYALTTQRSLGATKALVDESNADESVIALESSSGRWDWAYWRPRSFQERGNLEITAGLQRLAKQKSEGCPAAGDSFSCCKISLGKKCKMEGLAGTGVFDVSSASALMLAHSLSSPKKRLSFCKGEQKTVLKKIFSSSSDTPVLSSSFKVKKSTRMSVEEGSSLVEDSEDKDSETAPVVKWEQMHSVVWASGESQPTTPRLISLEEQQKAKEREESSSDWLPDWDDKPCLISRSSDRVSFEDRTLELTRGVQKGVEEKKGAQIEGPSSIASPTGLQGEKGFAWIRSQMIGIHADIATPFGTRQLTYADYVASGRCLQYVEDLLQARVLPYYGNTHTEDSLCGQRTTYFAHEAGEYIKACVRAGPEHRILFCGSGCTGAVKRLQEVMGVAVPSTLRARVLASMAPSERWVVFVGPYEHHSNLLTWRQSLADVVEVPLNEEGVLDLAYLERELQNERWQGRPKLGSISAASNVTGILTDTRPLCALLHAHGAAACLDFAAAAPYVDIDMRAGQSDGCDAILISPHKFVGGPGSAGILVVSQKLYALARAPPSTSGGGTVTYVNGVSEEETLYIDNIEQREDAGTPAILQKMRAALAFYVKSCVGPAAIERAEKGMIETAIKRLGRNPKVEVLGNCEVPRLAVLSFLIRPFATANNPRQGKALNGRFVVKLLNDLFGIQARGGCSCAGPYGHALMKVDRELSMSIRDAIAAGFESVKPGWTRLGFAYFITQAEFDFILTAIEFIAEHGLRFLQLYDFDWRSGNWQHKGFETEDKSLFEAVTVEETAGLVEGRKQAGVTEPPYDKYLRKAREMVQSLPPYAGVDRPCDPEIDERVVTFVV